MHICFNHQAVKVRIVTAMLLQTSWSSQYKKVPLQSYGGVERKFLLSRATVYPQKDGGEWKFSMQSIVPG